jgi:hypothetical protein
MIMDPQNLHVRLPGHPLAGLEQMALKCLFYRCIVSDDIGVAPPPEHLLLGLKHFGEGALHKYDSILVASWQGQQKLRDDLYDLLFRFRDQTGIFWQLLDTLPFQVAFGIIGIGLPLAIR